jgi:hypothetical protein
LSATALTLAAVASGSVALSILAGRRRRRWLAIGAAANAIIAMAAAYVSEVSV